MTRYDDEPYEDEPYEDDPSGDPRDDLETADLEALGLDEDELEHGIAVLAMAGRFPGARDLDELWRNLAEGVESITFFEREELAELGVSPSFLAHPSFVPASPKLDDFELFDAAFFDLAPREAEILDPQSRLFLECSWEALERAGYVSERYEGWIGVFAGTSASSYMRWNLETRPDVLASQGWFPIYLANDRDYFTTRVSYKLNLRGPSMNIQSACSTSLVAIHQACQSLLDFQCHLALAGGVHVAVPSAWGYVYEPGGITSPDGHCRPFDAKAEGSIFGSGVGVVVLKRLEDALRDRDPIAAVIRGSAINNDGDAKVGFTAPSVKGQAEVIAMAHEAAAVDVSSVTYVEAHGSGTALGDPIEVEALGQAFRAETDAAGFCALGSVKSNFGHLEAAAGIAGFIKTVLSLEHGEIPPTVHFEAPNPRLELEGSPFFVSSELRPWERGDTPRRAGVSAFGMGGTNAHVLLEEAPEALLPTDPGRPWQLVPLAARTPTALDRATADLQRHLEEHPELDLADVAYTLGVGRRGFEHRRVIVARDRDAAVQALAEGSGRVLDGRVETTGRPVAFLLPGIGEHYVDMGRDLYREESVFRAVVDRCAEILKPILDRDVREILFPEGTEKEAEEGDGNGNSKLDLKAMLGRGGGKAPGKTSGEGASRGELDRTRFAHPIVFTISWALAELWKSWGVKPAAVIGHSLGEYVAATLAGVFRLEDALALVAERARLVDELPGGAMLAVPLAEEEVTARLPEGLSLAAVNGPEVVVVAGETAAVDAFAEELRGEGHAVQRLPTTHAFHCALMEPAAAALAEKVAECEPRAPEVPFVSNLSGGFVSEEVADPAYWARHLTHTVRFADGLGALLEEPGRLLVEVGPGQGLGALVHLHPAAAGAGATGGATVIPSLRSHFNRRDDRAFFLEAVGRLWLAGGDVDGASARRGERRRRVVLPTYPFERQRFWIESGNRPGKVPGTSQEVPGTSQEMPSTSQPPTSQASLEMHQRPRNLATPYQAPRTPLEESIAGVWQEVLGIEPIGVNDSYFDMGGHSLLAPKLLLNLAKEIHLDVPIPLFLEHPTVAQLAEVVEGIRSGEVEAVATAVDLEAEVRLDDDIRPEPGSTAGAVDAPSAVFVTGGTGFLGAFLIDELAAQTPARLHCLVRAADEAAALARLRQNLEHHGVWNDALEERLVAIPGDLASPRLGLDDATFAALAEEVEAIYHAGAWVNFTYPYRVLAPANVEGTREALRLAVRGRLKLFHFISSTAVFSQNPGETRLVREGDPLADPGELFAGYGETKWVCEKILDLARERGIPVAVYRPGVIGGDSQSGAGNTSDLVWNVLKGCLQLGGVLDVMPKLDVAPADYVARAIVHLSRRDVSLGQAFHFSNSEPKPWLEIFDLAESMGYEVRRMTYPDWRGELGEIADRGEENALVSFLPLLPEVENLDTATDEAVSALEVGDEIPSTRFDDRHTLDALEGSGIECPPLDEALIRIYIDYFISCGFLPPPPSEESRERTPPR